VAEQCYVRVQNSNTLWRQPVVLSVKLDNELNERISRLADDRNRSPQSIVNEALQQYVDKEEAISTREREALDALRDYRETGLHLTGEEVDAWLATWGTEHEVDAPECHK
jgi:predicted transcriptional regulator